MRNELEILTRINTLQRETATEQAKLLRPNDPPDIGQCATFAELRTKNEAQIEALNWVMSITELDDPIEGNIEVDDMVCLHVWGRVGGISDSHGKCYRVELPQRDFVIPRSIWVNESELSRNEEKPTHA